jgi:transposase
MYTVGLDVHWRTSTLCILGEDGRMVKTRTVRGSWKRLLAAVEEIPRPFQITYEASCGYGHLHDVLIGVAQRVVVAHPGRLRLIFLAKRKSDRVDAQKLAKLLYIDQVPTVYVPDASVRAWRGLIEYRRRLLDKRTRCKNGIRSLLRSFGVVAPRGKGLWTKKGRMWLSERELPETLSQGQLRLLLGELDHFNRQVKEVTGQLDAVAKKHPGVGLLKTVPGIGPRTAEAMVAYVDDPHRFRHGRQVGSYFGLTPSQDDSAEVRRAGHITKNGPSTVRKLLVEAAWQAIRHSDDFKAYFERIEAGKPDRRKIALVATANRLARVMGAMLRTGEVWREAA